MPAVQPISITCFSIADARKNEWSQSVQTWYREWPWDLLELVCYGAKGSKNQGHAVNASILHTRTAIYRHSLGGVTSCHRRIELYEYLFVVLIRFLHNFFSHAVHFLSFHCPLLLFFTPGSKLTFTTNSTAIDCWYPTNQSLYTAFTDSSLFQIYLV